MREQECLGKGAGTGVSRKGSRITSVQERVREHECHGKGAGARVSRVSLTSSFLFSSSPT